ncbi:MAG TPA: hypothetical protein VKA46_09270 [Gemmataceae bacterium]|nr:hypothetical protein [Gemmataceae bacterium]
MAPIIGAVFVHAFPGRTRPLALYVALVSAVSLICLLLLAETSRKDISTAD